MSLTLQFILAMSCLIPAIPALIKFRKADRQYYPFFLLLIVGVIAEMVSDIPFMLYGNYTFMDIAHPIYNILEMYLMLLFYRRNNIITSDTVVWGVFLAGIVIYTVNYCLMSDTSKLFVKYYDIGFAAVNIILAIRLLSGEIFETKKNGLKNPKMVIAFGCTLFYSFSLMVKVFLNLNMQTSLSDNIFSIHQIINVLTYLIFTWAILWIPTKKIY